MLVNHTTAYSKWALLFTEAMVASTGTHYSGQAVFRVVIGIICCSCLIALCWEQIVAYFERNTGVTQYIQTAETRRLPIIMFCPKVPFKVSFVMSNAFKGSNVILNSLQTKAVNMGKQLHDKESYIAAVKEFKVEFKGRIHSDYIFYKVRMNH